MTRARSRLGRAACGAWGALACAGAVQAQQPSAASAPLQWDIAAGASQRRLFEQMPDGGRLLTERGTMARLELGARWAPVDGPAVAAEAGGAAGSLDYDGQTQAGAPLATTSRQHDADLALLWRPQPAAAWGEGWLLLHGVRQHRDIRSTGRVNGLVETSVLLMPGLRWRGPATAAAGWQLRPQVEARVSTYHRLDVDYHGLFDGSRLEGGRRWALVLGLEAQAPDPAWRIGLRWTRARQAASQSQALYRDGVRVGSVRQPRLGYDDLALSLRRDF